MAIPIQQARAIFTNAYMAKYQELVPAPSFLRSFFTTSVYATKAISIEVQRGTEKIAVDVQRGVDGQRNSFSLSTEKQFIPPFYNENFDATQLDRYDVLFGADPSFSPATVGYLAMNVAEKLAALRAKIERAKELQCASVFTTGVVTLLNGDNIDFKRKAASNVDLNAGSGGGYWSTTSTDVEAQLIKAAEFIRRQGKNAAKVLNITMSSEAWVALKKTTYFTQIASFLKVQLFDINLPIADASGSSFMGRITAGAYTFNVWTYDEVYQDSTGTIQRYMPINQVFVTPVSGTRFELAHAGIPAIIVDPAKVEFDQFIQQQASEYWVNNYIDNQRKAHIFEIYSAPLAIPVTVDMIYTMQVLAN